MAGRGNASNPSNTAQKTDSYPSVRSEFIPEDATQRRPECHRYGSLSLFKANLLLRIFISVILTGLLQNLMEIAGSLSVTGNLQCRLKNNDARVLR